MHHTLRLGALALGSTLCAACAASVGAADAAPTSDAPATDAPRADATDAARCPPGTCVYGDSSACRPAMGGASGCCTCAADGTCSRPCRCASPDTPVATPAGERPIASLAVGDLVYSVDRGRVVAVPVVRTCRNPVREHRVVRVGLANGAALAISAGHPTADGRTFGDLRVGDRLGDERVASVAVVPYAHDATYDVLPGSDTGTYFAAGALVGSTLHAEAALAHGAVAETPAEPAGPR